MITQPIDKCNSKTVLAKEKAAQTSGLWLLACGCWQRGPLFFDLLLFLFLFLFLVAQDLEDGVLEDFAAVERV